ncbi:HNH endonuclease signature motif containing protein [Microbacterium karelineae]|uniref:HNH endonuclease signature motif containing protein n=1 Tax=Microbacterium karelineae TaxID=2654283 RepID=UPI0018D3EF90|nr:HNH endonuclease signature motif containing protein [Microbacterium karelineae]
MTPDEVSFARGLVDQLVDIDRQIAALQGQRSVVTAELARIAQEQGERENAEHGPEYARRAMAAEIAAATRVHPATANAMMGDAETLTEGFPAALEALREGRISKRHADVIVDAGRSLDDDDRSLFDDAAVELAATRTPGDLGRLAKVAADRLAQTSLRERHRAARAGRRVVMTEREDGMSELWAFLPTLEARAIRDRLTQMGRALTADRRRARRSQNPDGASEGVPTDRASEGAVADRATAGVAATDERTLDQLRADLLTDLLLTSAPTGHRLHTAGTTETLASIRATVQVTIPATMILDPDEGTSWIDEGALCSPDGARQRAGSATGWDRLFVESDTGEILSTDHYRPTASQRRRLIGRDVTCRFPGCTVPARKADLDHTFDFARGGPTAVGNLSALCESHHMMKHHSGWRVEQVAGGVLEWTSPTGRVHRDEPPSRVFFADSPGKETPAATDPAAPAKRIAPAECPEAADRAEAAVPAKRSTRAEVAGRADHGEPVRRAAEPRRRADGEIAPLVASALEGYALHLVLAATGGDLTTTDTDGPRIDLMRVPERLAT